MPLQDSFKRRPVQATTEQSRPTVTPLASSPTTEDLRYAMQRAEVEGGRPVILSWRSNDKQAIFLLTVTTGAKQQAPTWTLHQGSEENAVVIFVWTTSDTELIRTLIQGADKEESAVKAEIPDYLKLPDPLTDPALATAPLPHEEFADKYELISRVGQGGMGMIYKARHKESRQIVALKVLHAHLLTDLESKRRFEQEASSCKALNHKNVLAVHEFGFSKHGQPYMTMEFLNGKSLSSWLTDQGRLDARSFVNVFAQICDGLHHAHEHGVVHRDVKPGNIMICKQNQQELVKIVDFGIAKTRMGKNREQITPTGNVLGSPAYIAPEQCAGADADPRSDIYSLGCVMYESVSGKPPFLHDNPIKVLMMQLSEPPPPFAVTCPDLQIPGELEKIIMRCLEKVSGMRYQTAAQVAVDLRSFAAAPAPASSQHKMTAGRQLNSPDMPDASTSAGGIDGSASAPPQPQVPQATGGVSPAGRQMAEHEAWLQPAKQDSAAPHLIPNQESANRQYADNKQHTAASFVSTTPQTQPSAPVGMFGTMPAPVLRVEHSAESTARKESQQEKLLMRFKRFRGAVETDIILEGLLLARTLKRKNIAVTVLLDMESVELICKAEILANRFHLDKVTVKKLSTMQALLQNLLHSGITVTASAKWAKQWCQNSAKLMPGVCVVSDEEIADLLIDFAGRILDY